MDSEQRAMTRQCLLRVNLPFPTAFRPLLFPACILISLIPTKYVKRELHLVFQTRRNVIIMNRQPLQIFSDLGLEFKLRKLIVFQHYSIVMNLAPNYILSWNFFSW